MLRELVFSTSEYFGERVKYPQIRYQALIVFLTGVTMTLWRPLVYLRLGPAAVYIEDPLILLTIFEAVGFLVIWIVLTGIIYLIAMIVGGKPTYGRLLRLTGYGFTPLIITGLVSSIGMYLALGGVNPPTPPQFQSPDFMDYYQYSYTDYIAQASGDPILIGSLIFGSIFVLAAGYFWLRAVMVESELEERLAAIPAFVAVALVLGIVLSPLL